MKKHLTDNKNAAKILIITAFAFCSFTDITFAASTPTLNLTSNSSTVGINVTGADPNAVVMFYFPNSSSNNSNSTSVSYTPINIGQTDSTGSFSVSVAANSYGLNGGVQVYVSVDNVNSATVTWPVTINNMGQNGGLSISQQNVTMLSGQTVNIYPMNTSNNLSVQGNSNPSVASAYYQASNNTVLIGAQNTGSSTISICASSVGCSTVNVSVQAPTQTITFSQSPVYLVLGQSAQIINIYGSGSGYSISNPNQNGVTAALNGTSLSLQGFSVGQTTLSICAPGWLCGSLTVNVVNSGTAVPYQAPLLPSANSNFSQPPQLTSLSISSNDVLNLFFGANSTININFSVNQMVNNVQVKIAGQQSTVGQGSNGTYSVSYHATGNESLPLPVAIFYTNPSGLVGQTYFWIGNSASTVPVSDVSTVSPSQTTSSASYSFANYLYMGMTKLGVSDPDVLALQQRLLKDGYFSGPVSGYFGSVTKTALQAYQKAHGLSPLGVVGPGTRDLLNRGI